MFPLSMSSLARFSTLRLLLSAALIAILFSLYELDVAAIVPGFDKAQPCPLGSPECSSDTSAPATPEPATEPAAPTTEPSPPEKPALPPLTLPDDYNHLHETSDSCARRLGLAYLEDLRRSRAEYCADASSQVTCFHSQVEPNDRIDSFCVANSARVDGSGEKFEVKCDKVDPKSVELNESSVPMSKFINYWYDTGPHFILNQFVHFEPATEQSPPPPPLPSREADGTNIILIKREGAWNPWHSLMEIMSLSMTIDVLQMSPRGALEDQALPFLTPDDGENTQVVILDSEDDGPYFDLWRLFAKKSILRLAELPVDTAIRDIIIPLPGGSNPVWRGDWEPNDCGHSELLRTFSRRVLGHFSITDDDNDKSNLDTVVVTFIERLGTRKLVGAEDHIEALRRRYTKNGAAHVTIHVVDFAALPFDEQIRVVRNSDVLAGVHGAGLTHGLWMRERSVMVEILPEGFTHKGFRNLAGALGHNYFSTHGSQPDASSESAKSNWQMDDVALERERFLEVMDLAIKSMYNVGRLNLDVTE